MSGKYECTSSTTRRVCLTAHKSSWPAPVIRREAFAARFGGLQYHVRHRVLGTRWHFGLGTRMWQGNRGWYFDFIGEHISSPVAYAVHTDGRIGVTDGVSPFQEIASSAYHLIESHALLDGVASWSPWRGARRS